VAISAGGTVDHARQVVMPSHGLQAVGSPPTRTTDILVRRSNTRSPTPTPIIDEEAQRTVALLRLAPRSQLAMIEQATAGRQGWVSALACRKLFFGRSLASRPRSLPSTPRLFERIEHLLFSDPAGQNDWVIGGRSGIDLGCQNLGVVGISGCAGFVP